MEALRPQVVHIPLRCAFKAAPCPRCGKPGRRKRTLTRQVRTLAYRKVAYLDVTYGEYQARCRCCATFRNRPAGVPPKGRYDGQVRQAVLDRLLEDAMSVEGLLRALRRDFLLELSPGFVYDCLRREVARLDLARHRRLVLGRFSGTLCVDELHLGRYTLLLATDPLADLPVAFALVRANDGPHMRRFLGNLRRWGLEPRVVVTDGSGLYPALIAALWPRAAHQLCVFHVLKDLNGKVLDEVRRLRGALARRGRAGRRRRRGRPAGKRRRRLGLKEKARFIAKHRYLIVKRQRLSAREARDLRQMFDYLPALATLWRFARRVHGLLAGRQSAHRAWCHRAALVKGPAYQGFPGLVEALGLLEPGKFAKMIAFLKSPARQRVRTNNHVERANRKLRYFEKVRYKWRRRRTLVRFLVLALDRWWREVQGKPPEGAERRRRQKARENKGGPAIRAPPAGGD